MKAKITEIFYWIQWEWPSIWRPVIFVRFHWCNLNCKFCDTEYAKTEWDIMTLPEILSEIRNYNCNHIVFTWWEPALKQWIISQLRKDLPWYFFEIETNWTIELKPIYDQINISPKLSNSWNNYELANFGNINFWRTIFKFVVWNEKDVEEVMKFCRDNAIPRSFVYLMPKWKTRDEQLRLYHIIELCLNHKVRFSPRLHILYFNNKRWV